MSRHSKMDGGSLIPPQVVAVEEGRQEMLKQSHIKVDSNYFAIDPNMDFESSTILAEMRVYTSDQVPDPTQPITFTIQPQFNVFRSLSESFFVFLLQCNIGSTPITPGTGPGNLAIIPKPYWSALFVNNFTININNVACNDQHSRTAQYAHFVKTVLVEGNLKQSLNVSVPTGAGPGTTIILSSNCYGIAGEDTRTLTEGIVNTDYWAGLDSPWSLTNNVLGSIAGYGCSFSNVSLISAYPPVGVDGAATAIVGYGKVNIELTYRPKDGIWSQPKFLCPGVNLNYVFNLNSLGTFCNGYITLANAPYTPNGLHYFSVNPDTTLTPYTYSIVRAQYYEKQYTSTQTCLRAFQSLIMRQPLYYSCLTSNTLLYPVAATQTSVQLTNVFSGRLPNIMVIALLNQSPLDPPSNASPAVQGNTQQLLTYSPLPAGDRSFSKLNALLPADCISSCILTTNGRIYPHLFSTNMLPHSNQDLSQWYDQYKQCCLIAKAHNREDCENLNLTYKMDNPLLSFGEFKANLTLWCFNIRRNGTVISRSGDKEVGGVDVLVNINGTAHPNAQLMIVGINTDSLLTLTDGGSTSSFVF